MRSERASKRSSGCFRDAMNEFIRTSRPKKWNAVIAFVGTLVTEMQRNKRLELEKRIEALEARAANFKYVGAWREGRYARGNLCSMGGAVFFCSAAGTDSRPGICADCSLMIPKPKDGRDGRDGRDAQPEPPAPRTVRSHR
jgi:hypothetical protein